MDYESDKKFPDFEYTREQHLENLHRFSVPHKEIIRLFDELREQEKSHKDKQINMTKTDETYNLDDYPTLRGLL